VAPVLVLLSYLIGPSPMDLYFWPGAVVMMLVATVTAAFVTNGGRSAWFVGVLVLMVYMIFANDTVSLTPGCAVKSSYDMQRAVGGAVAAALRRCRTVFPEDAEAGLTPRGDSLDVTSRALIDAYRPGYQSRRRPAHARN